MHADFGVVRLAEIFKAVAHPERVTAAAAMS
jgi:hypothetical protein